MNFPVVIILQLVVLLISIMAHEVAHGYVAERLGDPTARNEKRLTFNPIAHIDPFGTIILPILLAVAGAPIFGWAKPVPYNPNNLQNPKTGAAKIAVAGPLTNLLIAVVFAVALRVVTALDAGQFMLPLGTIVYINLLLAVFNLFPIPPLDGSKFLFLLLPSSQRGFQIMAMLEQFGFVFLVAFIMYGSPFLTEIINLLYKLFVGVDLRG